MITTPEEFLKKLYLVNNKNVPTIALLMPSTETIYNVDLNKRTIEAPEFLSVETDHFSETVYFKVDRYYDNMDLTNTVCIIQYENKNAKKEDGTPAGGYAYLVPFYDIQHFKDENKILIPWAIGGPATAAAGDVDFAIRFYQVSADGQQIVYSLNTLPSHSKVLHGMNVVTEDNENFIIPTGTVEDIYNQINILREQISLYWIDAF